MRTFHSLVWSSYWFLDSRSKCETFYVQSIFVLHIINILFFSNLGKGEGERDNALSIIHKSSCDNFQSVYFISKLFPITRKDFFKIHFYISSVDVYNFILSMFPNLCWHWKDKTLYWWGFLLIIFWSIIFPTQKSFFSQYNKSWNPMCIE